MRKLLAFVLIIFVSGCVTTALYGNKFEPLSDDKYTLEIMFGGLPITSEKEIELKTRGVLETEAEKFIALNNMYTSYEIISYERASVPSAIVYTVQFKANK